ncbi:DUF6328 family protein [Microbacterium dauci]|uniref:DUF6328 family protein n=1 Tax=Microbacterium dauci TaxID=3048008 RepID=A0ABT6ZF16_9MICO|nr:DUF6328 family protein [Microbacterium sp. LX3-4]MDJ1114756.1 DUF6328 family protein [Microbacterium sp. LX3-4]
MSGAAGDVAPDDGRNETANERADRNWNDLLQELRVTQTGTQLISGFLLAVAFQSRFPELDEWQLGLYVTLVALAAASTFLGLAVVVVHRLHFAKHVKSRLVRDGGRILVANMAIVVVLTAGVTSLIVDFALDRTAGLVALGAALVFSAGLFSLLVGPRGRAG